ncbi:MAG: hypothetical protein ICV60_16760 [Pyrinomonadaceae bacterium]|nr:hypothetical protein [Pyrinomonadaceae bacterium]
MPLQRQLKDEGGIADIPLKKLFYLSIAILVVQVIFGYLTYLAFGKWEDRASFGSMFGATSSLFSGWAFAGVIYAILLQRRDLELQRRELEMTREELKRSAEAQERSEQALLAQAKMMELTAKLTAKNFLAEVYRNKMEFLSNRGLENQKERDKWNDIILELEELTGQISN